MFPGAGDGEAAFEETWADREGKGRLSETDISCSQKTLRGKTVGRHGGEYLDRSSRGKGAGPGVLSIPRLASV